MTNNDELALKVKTYAVNCNDAWLNTEGDDISDSYVKYKDYAALLAERDADKIQLAELESKLNQNESWSLAAQKYIAYLESQAKKLVAEIDADKKRIAELESENEYVRKRFKELDLLFGKNLLVMKAAIIEWQSTGEARTGLSWIFNTLLGPGELPSEEERDAQAYFDREYAPMDEELMALHKWFWERSDRIKAEREAAGIKLEVGE